MAPHRRGRQREHFANLAGIEVAKVSRTKNLPFHRSEPRQGPRHLEAVNRCGRRVSQLVRSPATTPGRAKNVRPALPWCSRRQRLAVTRNSHRQLVLVQLVGSTLPGGDKHVLQHIPCRSLRFPSAAASRPVPAEHGLRSSEASRAGGSTRAAVAKLRESLPAHTGGRYSCSSPLPSPMQHRLRLREFPTAEHFPKIVSPSGAFEGERNR